MGPYSTEIWNNMDPTHEIAFLVKSIVNRVWPPHVKLYFAIGILFSFFLPFILSFLPLESWKQTRLTSVAMSTNRLSVPPRVLFVAGNRARMLPPCPHDCQLFWIPVLWSHDTPSLLDDHHPLQPQQECDCLSWVPNHDAWYVDAEMDSPPALRPSAYNHSRVDRLE